MFVVRNKKTLWLIGLLTLIINLVSVYFFLHRNKLGNYTRQVHYEELYSSSHNTPDRLKQWKQVIDQYSKSQIKEGKEITRNYAGLSDKDPALSKMIKIGAWLRRSLDKCPIGKPTESFNKLSYTEQYRVAAKLESPVWCGSFGALFQFFTSINGITCRYIESFGRDGNHIINESFIPELNQWVFVDLSHNVLFAKNKEGKILNTLDLLYLNARKDTASLTLFGIEDSVAPRIENANLWKDYLNTNNQLLYYYKTDYEGGNTFGKKIIRYFSRNPLYETFNLTAISNKAFYVRTLVFYTGIIALLIFILFYLKNR